MVPRSPLHKLVACISRLREVEDATNFFKNKKVVLIGPCVNSTQELEMRIREADVLALVNKGHRHENVRKWSKLAPETVLFHCLQFDEAGGGGMINGFDLRGKGISEVFMPLAGSRFDQNLANFHKSNVALLQLHKIDLRDYEKLQASIDGFIPNTGFAAIWTIVAGNCRALHVAGFSFMRTPYGEIYRDQFQTVDDVVKLIERSGNHNPDLDFRSFRELHAMGHITVDDTLEQILAIPLQPMFYQSK